MKILMVTNIYPHPERPHLGSFVKSQIDSIIKEGVDADVLFINTYKKRSIVAYWQGIREIRKRARSGKYDLIHAHYGYSGLCARCQVQLPVIVSYCGDDVLGEPDIHGRKKPSIMLLVWACQILTFFVPGVIVKSQGMKNKLIKRNNVFVVPNGVDFNMFKPMANEPLRKKFQMIPSIKYVLYASKPDEPRKCFPVIKKAVEILQKGGFSVELFVFQKRPPEEVPMAMNACDALALASYWEGSPNVVKESMAVNLPIVSVDVGDVKEIISECKGCAISLRNPKDMADKLMAILEKGERTNGRKHIQHLEIQRVAKRIVRMYSRIIRAHDKTKRSV